MKVRVEGIQGYITLAKNQFLAQGGEGSIYVQGRTAYKIYIDQKRMIPVDKIHELGVLKDSRFIKPEEVVFDQLGNPIGYTMFFLQDTHPLCKLFTKAFKIRHRVHPQQVFDLVRQLQDMVQHAHSQGILIVDLNELNFLVAADFSHPFAIDVDSYQTPHFPATAIMESVRDVHSKKFSEGTDWFSWAVVTFQLLIGIHPYKGKHDYLKLLSQRMEENVSVFDPSVRIPKMCSPLTDIPEAYRDYYKSVFQDGRRTSPPSSPYLSVVVSSAPVYQDVKSSDTVEVERLATFHAPITHFYFVLGKQFVQTEQGAVDDHKVRLNHVRPDHHIGILPKTGLFVNAEVKSRQRQLRLTLSRNNTEVQNASSCDEVMSYEGRLYVRYEGTVSELQYLYEGTPNMRALPQQVASVMPLASKFYDGCLIQNMLGDWWVSIFPEAGMHYQYQLKDLHGHKIVDAKYEKRVLMIVSEHNGIYQIRRYIVDRDFNKLHNLKVSSDTQYMGVPNFAVTNRGVVAFINNDDDLELFQNSPEAPGSKIVKDPLFSATTRLYSIGSSVVFTEGAGLYRLSTK